MEKFDELQKVLDAETPEEIFGLAAERIKELNNSVVEKEKKIDELEKKVEAKKLADTKERLLKEKEELKKKIADQNAKNAELDKQAASLQETLRDSRAHRKKLFADADPEIDKLKKDRMNIFKEAHGLLEGKSSPATTVKHSVVSDSAPRRRVLCYDGLDPVVDELKQKRMRIFQDTSGAGR